MNDSIVMQIESSFSQLSFPEQLQVIERLVHRVQNANSSRRATELAGQLALMANDPEIQSELRRIDEEFSHADADGLGTA